MLCRERPCAQEDGSTAGTVHEQPSRNRIPGSERGTPTTRGRPPALRSARLCRLPHAVPPALHCRCFFPLPSPLPSSQRAPVHAACGGGPCPLCALVLCLGCCSWRCCLLCVVPALPCRCSYPHVTQTTHNTDITPENQRRPALTSATQRLPPPSRHNDVARFN